MAGHDDPWLQRVRYAAAEPTSWHHHARTLRQAAEDLWTAGNAHDRAPLKERHFHVFFALELRHFVFDVFIFFNEVPLI